MANENEIYTSHIDEETLKDNSKLLLCPECDEIYLFEMINKRQRASATVVVKSSIMVTVLLPW